MNMNSVSQSYNNIIPSQNSFSEAKTILEIKENVKQESNFTPYSSICDIPEEEEDKTESNENNLPLNNDTSHISIYSSSLSINSSLSNPLVNNQTSSGHSKYQKPYMGRIPTYKS